MFVAALLGLLVGVATVTADFCPSGWSEFDGECFYVNRTKMTWGDALLQCHQRGGHLVTMDSAKENDYVTTLVKAMKEVTWVDGSDEQEEGKWVWSSSQVSIKFTNWSAGQPNGGSSQNCMLIYNNYKWHDGPCDRKYAFICEKDAQTTSGDQCSIIQSLEEELIKCRNTLMC